MKKIKLNGLLGIAAVLPLIASGCSMNLNESEGTASDVSRAVISKNINSNLVDVKVNFTHEQDIALAHTINKYTMKMVKSGCSDPAILDEIVMEAINSCSKSERKRIYDVAAELSENTKTLEAICNKALSVNRIDRDLDLQYNFVLGDVLDLLFADTNALIEASKNSPFTMNKESDWKVYADTATDKLDNAVFDYIGQRYDEPFPMIVDYLCRNGYPFESQGYKLRETLRNDYASAVANAGFMCAYSYMVSGNMKDAKIFTNTLEKFDKLLDDKSIQEIKRHDDLIICQIPFEQSGSKVYYVMNKEPVKLDYVDVIRSYAGQWNDRRSFVDNPEFYKRIFNLHKRCDYSTSQVDYLSKNFFNSVLLDYWSDGKTLNQIFKEAGFNVPEGAASETNYVYDGKIDFRGYHWYCGQKTQGNGRIDDAVVTAFGGDMSEKFYEPTFWRGTLPRTADFYAYIAKDFEFGYTTEGSPMIWFDNQPWSFGQKVTKNRYYNLTVARTIKNLGDVDK